MKAQLLFLNLLLINFSSIAQVFPDYQERALIGLKDSTLISQFLTTSSEGAIDPNEYKVGPGDILFISISGLDEKLFTPGIDPEGFIYIPRIGAIDLRNKTLSEAKIAIQSRLMKSFKDVDIHISLQNFRRIKVSLIGDVANPSTYVLSSSSRLLDLFVLSSGLTRSSDIRNIRINSRNGEQKKVDLLKFLRLGDYSQNPFLNDGDIVLVDKVERTVSLFGQIKYPASYEFKEEESVDEILKIAGGILFKARTDSIEIVRFTDDGKSQFSIYFSYEKIKSEKPKLKKGDFIIVREIPDYFDVHYVELKGEIQYPGVYKIKKDQTTLSQIINEAGGFKKDASLKDAVLYRTKADSTYDPELERLRLIPRADMTDDEYDYLKARSRQKKGRVVVDFEKLFLQKDSSEDVILKIGDIITIPEKKEYISIIGQVVNPGNITYKAGLTIDDYISIAGGYSWRAKEGDVRVIRANTGEWVDADDVDELKPGDTIWVPEDPPGPKFWEVFTTSLQVLGQIAAVVAATVAVIVATR
ncbi:MAG: SLBB domain-containing protein [Ignavibacterium sp.]|uniref:SLBB domain-containing protein n=1 Tax=Ignavibacterium sp. TaxID=2651167 RepID=UPI0032985258